ncbi:uncharacterized protein LOC131628179 [Vicia villosa]|uniref:uncharacterized protein LOC131628179 n=1 Tax=Vicia villosa TaxID=3911 RepID=UPI00273CC072|nr:uncharacterized protein LOC131628179 [Vicia villosa]
MATDASVSSIKLMNQDLVKLDHFDGTNYTRWQDKMTFLLTTLKIQYVLDHDLEEILEPIVDDTDKRRERNEIWKALELKFKAEDEGTKRFLISKYFDFKILDSTPIIAQVHELQVLVNKIKAVKIDVPKAFQVGAIIAKLPPSWNGYRKKLLHSSEDFSLEKLQKHLRIEEEMKDHEKIESAGFAKANTVAAKGKKKYDGTKNHLGPKKEYNRHNKPKIEVNAVHVNDDIIATVSEIMAIKRKVQGWWYDTCATVHVSCDKAEFKIYIEVNDGQVVQMGNEVRSRVVGTGSVELNFTSGKKVTLVNVLHVPDMNRNLVSGDLLLSLYMNRTN